MKQCAELFFIFLKMGCVAFGGGYAILPLLEREFIQKRGWLTRDEALEYMTLAQVTPGIIAVNLCTFLGNKRAGPLGGIAATIGFIIPGVTFISIIAAFLRNFADLTFVRHAFAGIRLAAAALIANAVTKMIAGLWKKKAGAARNTLVIFLCAASFTLSAFFKTNPVFIVLGAALLTPLFLPKGAIFPKTDE
ncbi:MAG: chromate transporter [Spirochaetaceae bacterium]|jgi:chromate transporter|nr:chromate transporter [Spirochaetaceae bacterium]